MEIHLSDLGKKFNREWLFENLNLTLLPGKSYAITGPNGSGKSTLLQVIAGNQLPSAGKVNYIKNGQEIPAEAIYKELVICTPYLELIEEFTLEEAIDFHFRFKDLYNGLTKKELITRGYFENARGKYIKHFSSGMKQRLKLLLTLSSEASLIFLDEPATNLDEKGITWYHELVSERTSGIIMVASNQAREYTFCTETISLADFK